MFLRRMSMVAVGGLLVGGLLGWGLSGFPILSACKSQKEPTRLEGVARASVCHTVPDERVSRECRQTPEKPLESQWGEESPLPDKVVPAAAWSIESMPSITDPCRIPDFAALLNKEPEHLRSIGVLGLACVGNGEACSILIAHAKGAQGSESKKALSYIRSQYGQEVLLEALLDADLDVEGRRAILSSLLSQHSPRVRLAVVNMGFDLDETVESKVNETRDSLETAENTLDEKWY